MHILSYPCMRQIPVKSTANAVEVMYSCDEALLKMAIQGPCKQELENAIEKI